MGVTSSETRWKWIIMGFDNGEWNEFFTPLSQWWIVEIEKIQN